METTTKTPGRLRLPDVGMRDGNYAWEFYYDEYYYKHNTRKKIAKYAKEYIDYFKYMTPEEIEEGHIYFASEGHGYHARYNGDTLVLFTDPDELPDVMKLDACSDIKVLNMMDSLLDPGRTLSRGNDGKFAYPENEAMRNLWCILWDNFIDKNLERYYRISNKEDILTAPKNKIKLCCISLIGNIARKKGWTPDKVLDYYIFPYAVHKALDDIRADERFATAKKYYVAAFVS